MLHLVMLPVKLLFKPAFFITFAILVIVLFFVFNQNQNLTNLKTQISDKLNSETKLKTQLASVQKELTDLKNTDQVKKNLELQTTIKNIEDNYKKAVTTYEKIIDYQGTATKKSEYTDKFSKALKQLSDRDYTAASTTLDDITKKIKEEQDKAAAAFQIPANVPTNNAPPSSGYAKQKVAVDGSEYLIDIISADLNSTKVIVDTASDSDCKDNCPVLALSDYISRSGAFAGINGAFFCPASYPSCAGKTNSFDTLLMNKNKQYFNSDNNVYSEVPAVVFSGSSIRFLTRSMDWGRDTGIDSMIANYPLYVVGGNVQFSGNGDPKIDNKGTRTFIASKDNMVYIGIVYNASAGDAAKALKTLGLQNALGLDQGGSTALWYGGYKAGPGRAIPNAILFVKR